MTESKVDIRGVLREFAMRKEPFGSTEAAVAMYEAADKAMAELIAACERLIEDSKFMREEYSDMNAAVDHARAALAACTPAKPEGR